MKSLGRYSLLGTLGRGASATIKLAFDTETGEEVALKIFKASRRKEMQAELSAWAHGDAFDFVATLFLQCGVSSQRSVDRGREHGALALGAVNVPLLEGIYDLVDVLCMGFVGDQKDVFCMNDHHVADSIGSDHAFVPATFQSSSRSCLCVSMA